MFKKAIFLIFLTSLFSFTIDAQKLKLPRFFGKKKGGTQWYGDPVTERKLKNNYNIYSTVGVGGGTSNYYGDMTTYKYPIATIAKMTRWNLSANYTKHFNYKFAARLALSYARIAGDDDNYKNTVGAYLNKYYRGLHFRNDLKEFSLTGVYDFVKYRQGGYTMRPKFTPYVFGGLALTNHNPKARAAANQTDGSIARDWLKLRPLDTEGQVSALNGKLYSTVLLALPVGAGFRYKITNQLDLTIEGGLRATLTKGGRYLDDLSGDYIASAGTATTPTEAEKFSYRAKELFAARTGNQRTGIVLPDTKLLNGDPAKRGNGRQDWYFLTILSLNYYIPSQIKCLPIR